MIKKLLIVGAFAVLPIAAQADINYNYVQFDWIADGSIAPEGSDDIDYDGFGIEGSVLVHPNVFIMGQAAFTDAENIGLGAGDAAVDWLSVGPGLRLPLIEGDSALDVYGTVTYDELDLAGQTSDGWGATVGLRWLVLPNLEINPSIGYVDYGEFDGVDQDIDGERYGIRGIFNVTDNAAVVLDYRTLKGEASGGGVSGDVDFEDEIRIGARWNFN